MVYLKRNVLLKERCIMKKEYEPRKYQKDTFDDCVNAFHNKEIQSVLMVMPTGTGKTKVAVDICYELLKNTVKHIYWFAHRNELCDQARAYFSDAERFSASEVTVDMVSSIAGLLNKFSQNSLIVFDEAHHCTAETYCLNSIKQTGARIMGLTATPFRTDIGGMFARNFNIIVERFNLPTAINNGWLIGFSIEAITDRYKDILKSVSQEYKNPDFTKHYYQKLCTHIADLISSKPEHSKSLIFCNSRNFDAILENLRNDMRFRCEGIKTGYHSSPREREDLIKKFHDGEIDVLVNIGILTEGFDDTEISQIFLLRDTQSRIQMTQIIGRGLRKPVKAKFSECRIYNLLATDVLEKIYTGFIGTKEEGINSAVSSAKRLAQEIIAFKLDEEKIAFESNIVSALIREFESLEWVNIRIMGTLRTPDGEFFITDQHIAYVSNHIEDNQKNFFPPAFPETVKKFIYRQRKEQKALSDNSDFWKFLQKSGLYCPLENYGLDECQKETLSNQIKQRAETVFSLFNAGMEYILPDKTAGQLAETVCTNTELSNAEQAVLEQMFAKHILRSFWEKHKLA